MLIKMIPKLADLREVVHDELGRHRLAGARLAADDDALVLVVNLHVAVHGVGEGVHVGRVLVGRLCLKHGEYTLEHECLNITKDSNATFCGLLRSLVLGRM